MVIDPRLPDESAPATAEARRRVAENGQKADEEGLGPILIRFGEEIFDASKRLMEVYADRVRIGVRKSILQAVLGAAAAVCAIVWLSASSLATLRGLCGGVAALFGGREWAGNLGGGLLALGLTAGGIALWQGISTRRELKRLEVKYAARGSEPGREGPPAPAEHR